MNKIEIRNLFSSSGYETKAFFIRRAFELYATGAYTVEKLREQLAEEGFNKDRNTPITKKGVYTILKNPFYMGVYILESNDKEDIDLKN